MKTSKLNDERKGKRPLVFYGVDEDDVNDDGRKVLLFGKLKDLLMRQMQGYQVSFVLRVM